MATPWPKAMMFLHRRLGGEFGTGSAPLTLPTPRDGGFTRPISKSLTAAAVLPDVIANVSENLAWVRQPDAVRW